MPTSSVFSTNVSQIKHTTSKEKSVPSSFETGISEHFHLIYSMLKTIFEKEESKTVTYRNYNQFQWETFEKDLTRTLRNCNGEYENYEQNFVKLLNTCAPKKVKI